MSIWMWCFYLGSLWFVQFNPPAACSKCGIRKHSFDQLVYRGYKDQEGEWPWHAGLFHKTDGGSPSYACGGSLINSKHILTAAHCVWNRNTSNPLPAASIQLHFGQHNLSEITPYVQIRDVSKVHVHPGYSTHRNDIAVLVMRLSVEYSEFVIPICMNRRVDIDLRNLVGQRGWITGWGKSESGNLSDVLHTLSMPVVSYLHCLKDDRALFGTVLDDNVFCAGDRNGTSPGNGDSGGGMYFSEGDRWMLRGIVSFAKVDELTTEIDTSKYAVFVNVQKFITWIKEIVDGSKLANINEPKRISEQECDRFEGLVRKSLKGICTNSRYPHTISLIYDGGTTKCSGILVNENHILTAAHCIKRDHPTKVQFEGSIHNILNMTSHPKHSIEQMYYNLAVIKLKTSVHLSSNMVPVCLASNGTENLYDTLIQTGFGHDDGSRTFIESHENKVIPTAECKSLVGKKIRLLKNGTTPAQLCVANRDQLRNRTRGYSGGALQSVNSRTCMYTVVGVFSFGAQFKKSNPSNLTEIDFYTRVTYHLDWIEQIIWNVDPLNPMMTTISTTEGEPTVNNGYVLPDD